MRRHWPLTLRGAGALALATACFVVAQRAGIPELMYFGVLLVGLVVAGAAALWLMRRGDDVVRTVRPSTTDVGGVATVVVRAYLRTALPAAPGRWRDVVPPGLRGRAEGALPAAAANPRGTRRPVELRYEVVGQGRGIHLLGPLELVTTDPFGLVRRRLAIGTTTPVVVAPRIVDLAPLPGTSGEPGGTRHDAALPLGQGADNLVARPYTPGDSMRRIHWRATAHRDTLMVRQEEQEASPVALVVLDRGVSRWSPDATVAPGLDPAFETALSACVSIVARLVREGYTVDVVDSDGTALSEPVGGDAAAARVLASTLATLTARADDPERRLVPPAAASVRGPVVVVTGALGDDAAAAHEAAPRRSALPVLWSVADAVGPGLVAGWRTTALSPGGDVSAAWSAVVEREPSRVGR